MITLLLHLLRVLRFVGAISSPAARHDGYSRGCRNQNSSFRELMAKSRLSPVDETADALGLSIRLLFTEEPKRGFGEMPSYGADGLRVALAPGDALVEATDVAVRVAAAHQTDRVRGFDEHRSGPGTVPFSPFASRLRRAQFGSSDRGPQVGDTEVLDPRRGAGYTAIPWSVKSGRFCQRSPSASRSPH